MAGPGDSDCSSKLVVSPVICNADAAPVATLATPDVAADADSLVVALVGTAALDADTAKVVYGCDGCDDRAGAVVTSVTASNANAPSESTAPPLAAKNFLEGVSTREARRFAATRGPNGPGPLARCATKTGGLDGEEIAPGIVAASRDNGVELPPLLARDAVVDRRRISAARVGITGPSTWPVAPSFARITASLPG